MQMAEHLERNLLGSTKRRFGERSASPQFGEHEVDSRKAA